MNRTTQRMSKAAKALNPADPTKVDRTWQIRIAVEIPGLTTLKSDGVTKRRKRSARQRVIQESVAFSQLNGNMSGLLLLITCVVDQLE